MAERTCRAGVPFVLACTVLLLSGCATPPAEPVAQEGPPTGIVTLCRSGEATVFSGNVDDDFGLGISVCVSPAMSGEDALITVRSSGEGGETAVSCKAADCKGVIGWQHYRRPRFTILTLEWLDDGNLNRIVESFDAEDPAQAPRNSVRYYWKSAQMRENGAEALEYPVEPCTQPLYLLALADELPAHDWPASPLSFFTPGFAPTETSGMMVF